MKTDHILNSVGLVGINFLQRYHASYISYGLIFRDAYHRIIRLSDSQTIPPFSLPYIHFLHSTWMITNISGSEMQVSHPEIYGSSSQVQGLRCFALHIQLKSNAVSLQ